MNENYNNGTNNNKNEDELLMSEVTIILYCSYQITICKFV